MLKDRHEEPKKSWPMRLAIAGIMIGILVLTLAGSWAEARWPNAAGGYITVTPLGTVNAAEVLWQLQRLDGVRDAVAVFRTALVLDETLDTGWSSIWLLANQTDSPDLAFLPPDPAQELWQGHLPESPDEAVLGYELAQNLGLKVGDSLRLQNRTFTIAGIRGPSPRVPGNWAQVPAAAAEVLLPSSSLDHFVVVPSDSGQATVVARRIRQDLPDVAVLAPEWEIARAQRERMVLVTTLAAAAAFLLLLAVPAWAADAGRQGSTMLAALLSGAGGLAVGWAITTLANVYARNTLGLTPLRVTPRLALAVLGLAALAWLLGALLPFRRSWALRGAATLLLLALCSAAVMIVGALQESLSQSLSQARDAATDWVTLAGVEADQRLLQALSRVPGIRGYMIEAAGGPADEDEERWLGPPPPSGVVYGVSVAGGEGTLSVPYRRGYARGGPLDSEKGGQAVVGYDLALAQGLTVGDTVEIRGVPFTVAGIRERLSADPGSEANYRLDISLPDLARVLHQPAVSGEMTLLIPPAEDQEGKATFLRELATRLNVGQVRTVDDRLAEIARSYPAAWTLTPASATEAVRHARVGYGNAVLLCALFALAASALSAAATMRARLARDEQHIGLLRALGSNEGTLLGEYLQIAAVLGVVAGLLGTGSGWALASYLNRWSPSGSPELILTPQLGAAVFFVTSMTAMLAAVAPTMDAVRQDATWSLYARQTDGGAECPASSGQVVQGGLVP